MKTKFTRGFCCSVGDRSRWLFGLGTFSFSLGDDSRTPPCFASAPSLPAHSYGGRTSPYYLKLSKCHVSWLPKVGDDLEFQ